MVTGSIGRSQLIIRTSSTPVKGLATLNEEINLFTDIQGKLRLPYAESQCQGHIGPAFSFPRQKYENLCVFLHHERATLWSSFLSRRL